jgi:hypothetical protein
MAGYEKLRKAETLYRDMEYGINSWQSSRWARVPGAHASRRSAGTRR